MDNNVIINDLFKVDESCFYINRYGERKFRGVDGYYGDTLRLDKAKYEVSKPMKSISEVFYLVNYILEILRYDNGFSKRNIKIDNIKLDNKEHTIIDNGIFVRDCIWKKPTYSGTEKKYIGWDEKYDIIKRKFKLEYSSNIVWLKFTTNGFLGVVAKSFDINFNNNNSSGKLVRLVGEEWDDSFVLIFPITNEMLGKKYSIGEIELAIGKYLIYNGVPIIDYYSHNN